MRRSVATVVVLTLGLSAGINLAEAGSFSFTRNITRNIDRRILRGMGGPFGGQLLGLFNDQLQPSSFLDEFLRTLARNLADGDTGAQEDDQSVAQRVATPDPDLTAADVKVREMARKLNITYIEISQTTTTTNNVTTASGLHPNFAQPAPIPSTFQAPTGQLPPP